MDKTPADDLRWVDILAIDDHGNSALMIAIREDKTDVAKFIIEKAINQHRLSEVLAIINNDEENAYSLALRSSNGAMLRLIEEATQKEKKHANRRSRKFHKYKSANDFKSPTECTRQSVHRSEMHRPKSEEAVGSASTSDIEPEIDETRVATRQHFNDFKEALNEKLNQLTLEGTGSEDRPDCARYDKKLSDEQLLDYEITDGNLVRTSSKPKNNPYHSQSFTVEHETIDFTETPNPGIMDSLGCKLRSIMAGRREDTSKSNKRASITTTQVHFTTMPHEIPEVYDGTNPTGTPTSNVERLTIAHHLLDGEDGDNTVCVPPEFKGPGDRPSGSGAVSSVLMKPLRNLRSRGSSSEGRARNYKCVPVDR
uniref:ANK_REP_REGION domain-containing protein n=1 Tax=Panagrellus redivivus TaxID=6233 RepID=A0A7E5A1U2_PANRE